jgi:hypothetical protein
MIALLGWAGAGVLLAAYALVSSKRITGDGAVFQGLNMAGGAALALNSAFNGAWPSAVLNVIWVAIGAVTMFRLARNRARQTRPEYQGVLTR